MTDNGTGDMPSAVNDNRPAGDAAAKPAKTLEKACPICGKSAVAATRPFCSKRCADVDLHRWLGGGYAIPVVEDPSDIRDDFDDGAAS